MHKPSHVDNISLFGQPVNQLHIENRREAAAREPRFPVDDKSQFHQQCAQSGLLVKLPVAVEKLSLEKSAKIKSRQDAV